MRPCLLFSIVACAIGCLAPDMVPETETRLSKYPQLLTVWQQRSGQLVNHFPPVIPSQATDARLSEFPGFLQGGAWFHLHMTLPAAEVAQIYRDAQQVAKAYGDGGKPLAVNDPKLADMRTVYFHHTTKNGYLPADFRIFILDGNADQRSPANNWNHGSFHGLAASQLRNEVIYFAEDW